MKVEFCPRSTDSYTCVSVSDPFVCSPNPGSFILYDEVLSGQRYKVDANTDDDPFRYIYDSDGNLVWKSYKMKQTYSASQDDTRLSIT